MFKKFGIKVGILVSSAFCLTILFSGPANAISVGDPVGGGNGGGSGGSSPVFDVAAAVNARLDAFEASYYPQVPPHVRVAAQAVIADLRARYS
jgi:hypothetical protein